MTNSDYNIIPLHHSLYFEFLAELLSVNSHNFASNLHMYLLSSERHLAMAQEHMWEQQTKVFERSRIRLRPSLGASKSANPPYVCKQVGQSTVCWMSTSLVFHFSRRFLWPPIVLFWTRHVSMHLSQQLQDLASNTFELSDLVHGRLSLHECCFRIFVGIRRDISGTPSCVTLQVAKRLSFLFTVIDDCPIPRCFVSVVSWGTGRLILGPGGNVTKWGTAFTYLFSVSSLVGLVFSRISSRTVDLHGMLDRDAELSCLTRWWALERDLVLDLTPLGLTMIICIWL
jgi:hypothetical protein